MYFLDKKVLISLSLLEFNYVAKIGNFYNSWLYISKQNLRFSNISLYFIIETTLKTKSTKL